VGFERSRVPESRSDLGSFSSVKKPQITLRLFNERLTFAFDKLRNSPLAKFLTLPTPCCARPFERR
jgi:hypothetical protein